MHSFQRRSNASGWFSDPCEKIKSDTGAPTSGGVIESEELRLVDGNGRIPKDPHGGRCKKEEGRKNATRKGRKEGKDNTVTASHHVPAGVKVCVCWCNAHPSARITCLMCRQYTAYSINSPAWHEALIILISAVHWLKVSWDSQRTKGQRRDLAVHTWRHNTRK